VRKSGSGSRNLLICRPTRHQTYPWRVERASRVSPEGRQDGARRDRHRLRRADLPGTRDGVRRRERPRPGAGSCLRADRTSRAGDGVGCKNSMRAPRNHRFAGRTLILAPHRVERRDRAGGGVTADQALPARRGVAGQRRHRAETSDHHSPASVGAHQSSIPRPPSTRTTSRVMIKRLQGYKECRLQHLHQPEPIRAQGITAILPSSKLVDRVARGW
jgi:hypothetical protein